LQITKGRTRIGKKKKAEAICPAIDQTKGKKTLFDFQKKNFLAG